MTVQMCKTILDYPSVNGSMAFWLSIRDCVPFAFEGLLVTIFIMLFFGNYFIVKSKTGRAKILVPLLASSIITMILSLFLAMAVAPGQTYGLVHYVTVIFWAFMSIVTFIIFLVSDYT